MAKSTSFFGMRTKSTKSLTFSTWRGMQITKDRVSDVSNPQTSSQMQQRVLMPLVAQARSRLDGLVNHSFQGVDYGYKSIYNFSSLNLKKGALTVGEYVPKGAMDLGAANFIVSTGSLNPVEIGVSNAAGQTLNGEDWQAYVDPTSDSSTKANCTVPVFGGLGNLDYSQDISSSTPTDDELENFFLTVLLEDTETDQLSFLVAQRGTPYTVNNSDVVATRSNLLLYRIVQGMRDVAGNDITFQLRSTETWAAAGTKHLSLVFGEDLAINCIVSYTPAADGTSGSIKLQKESFTSDTDKTNIFGASIIGASSVSDGKSFAFSVTASEDDIPFKGIAIINSRKNNNVWQRSTQRIVCLDYNPAVSYDVVLPTYLKSSSSSAKFLNNGSDSTGIDGNSGFDVSTSSFDDEKSQG